MRRDVEVKRVGGKWFLVPASGRLIGPFDTRAEAVEIRDEAHARLTKPRRDYKAILEAEIARPSSAPRGRPTSDAYFEIAIEYYWRRRQGESAARAIVGTARRHHCTPDFVRKCRAKCDALGDRSVYSDSLLAQLRHSEPLKREPGPAAMNAQQYLQMLLARGPVPSREVYSRGKVASFTENQLDHAKKALRVVSIRTRNGWNWSMPVKGVKG